MKSEWMVKLSWNWFDLLLLNLKIFLSDFNVVQVSKKSKKKVQIFPPFDFFIAIKSAPAKNACGNQQQQKQQLSSVSQRGQGVKQT